MYIDLPDYCFAYNAKAGISSFARAIIARYFPEHEAQVKQTLEENPESHYRHFYYEYLKLTKHATKPVILMVREPLQRFLSAMNYCDLYMVDDVITALENKSSIKIPYVGRSVLLCEDAHFRTQHSRLSNNNYLFRFPDHIQDAAEMLDLGPIDKLNKSRRPYLNVTQDQKDRIYKYYHEDLYLYDAIFKPKIFYQVVRI